MKLADAIREAVAERQAEHFGRICDFCRYKLGWDYNKFTGEVERLTGLPVPEIDELLAEADEIESAYE